MHLAHSSVFEACQRRYIGTTNATSHEARTLAQMQCVPPARVPTQRLALAKLVFFHLQCNSGVLLAACVAIADGIRAHLADITDANFAIMVSPCPALHLVGPSVLAGSHDDWQTFVDKAEITKTLRM